MSVVTLAVIIVAAFLGGLVWLICERLPLPAWACFALAVLAALIVYSLGPGVFA
jgi:hypothetical protein